MISALIVVTLILALLLAGCTQPTETPHATPTPTPSQPGTSESQAQFKPFESEKELREYVQYVQSSSYGFGFGFGIAPTILRGEVAVDYAEKGATVVTPPAAIPHPTPAPLPSPTPVPTPGRYSETNVQVLGIDEPDIVKTDGINIYLSNYWIYPIRFVPEIGRETKIITAFPPENLDKKYEIDESGNLLLYGNILIILTHDHISAYNVSEKPEKLWKIDLDSQLVSARLYNGSIFLITRKMIDYYAPCPIKPLEINGKPLVVECRDIYHPIPPVYADTTYTVLKVSPETGEVENSISFVGSLSQSVVYMSPNAIYVTYYKTPDQVKLMYDFLKENRDLVSDEVIKRVEKLLNYDISNRAKSVEIQVIIEQYASSLSKDERKKFENEFWNRLSEYRKEHKRELEKTQIVKISLNLEVKAMGEVPGRLLNQFSLDEYDGYLRVATSLGDTNDLYVLDKKLKITGSLLDYGENERIYAVRFIGERGYVVTFRQTDPFFVIDLSDPKNPEMKGKLKIPGYSSYLHPLKKDLILGIGKEGGNVKISIFDVSNPEEPKEVSKYTLKEYWSAILQTHHAFLLDPKHEIFFLPASTGGYIFSYKEKLELVKAIDMPAIRALYIDDYLYIIGQKIVVFNETTWEKVNELEIT
ncbi:MAG: beta-propeller domain-containing protein [Archaeoglobus sp.]|nr:beta-propeller domain-containing protein [Archaeoglobus sp.]